MCAVVRLRALMARHAARLITNPPIQSSHMTIFAFAFCCFFIEPLVSANQSVEPFS
jgi:hypothetical protein